MDKSKNQQLPVTVPAPPPLEPPALPVPVKEGKEGKEKFIDKALLKVSILITAISAAALLNIPAQIPNDPIFKRFFKAYVLLTFATFTMGLGSVVYCSLLHKPDHNAAVSRKLMWTGLTLMELSMALGAWLKMLI